eukprot:1193772-Karenia_brevis.AAC.1
MTETMVDQILSRLMSHQIGLIQEVHGTHEDVDKWFFHACKTHRWHFSQHASPTTGGLLTFYPRALADIAGAPAIDEIAPGRLSLIHISEPTRH